MRHHDLVRHAVEVFNEIFHTGTLDPADKQRGSYEGDGLSITAHPHAWARITPLSGPTWALWAPDNTFVDAHTLNDNHRQQVSDWAVVHGWLTYTSIWVVTYHDGDLDDDVTTSFTSETEARDELGDDTDTLTHTTAAIPTPALSARMVSNTEHTVAFADDWALIAYTEDVTTADGVWFNDRLNPHSYSAPRGVINQRALPRWTATPTT